MTSIPRFAADASAHDVAGALTTAGAAIIERLVPGSLVDELLGQMHPFIEATPFGGRFRFIPPAQAHKSCIAAFCQAHQR
jgi:hypothetical protein